MTIDIDALLLYNNLGIVPILKCKKVFGLTKQRKIILEIIKSSSDHMTAEEIYTKAKQIMPSIAVGTVYRNLGLMTEAGEIRRLAIPDKPDKYDKSVQPHEHLICQKCGEVSDLFVSSLQDYLQQQTGIEITGYDLNLRYICGKCKKEAAKKGNNKS